MRFKVIILLSITVAVFWLPWNNANSKNPISLSSEGWDYLNKGNVFKAIFSFKNALNKNPKYIDAMAGLGKAYYEIESFEHSYDIFKDILKIDNNSGKALTGIGFSLAGMGKYSEALKYFDRAVKVSEEDINAKYGIAFIYNLMGKRIWSVRKVRSILRINPYHIDSLLLMADIKSQDNRYNEARKYVDKAIDSNVEVPKSYIKLAEVLFRSYLYGENKNNLDESLNALNNALSIQPESYSANRLMGYILLKEKKYNDAIGFYEKSISKKNKNISIYSLAVSYDRSNKIDNAAKNLPCIGMCNDSAIGVKI